MSALPSTAAATESQTLLSRLLQSVQDCQKRFGGRTELATEYDPCVLSLCSNLESVLSHGLRNKPLDVQQALSLKQVSDIVSNSLHIGNDNPSFWSFVSKHLIKHEQERYISLKHIWSDCGRGRAWLRSALNERSLERYFHTLLSNQELLLSHYEPWALLCDHDKNSMLPNMAAGLNSILFAINIDRPELNSGIPLEKSKIKTQIEPIIEAPSNETLKARPKHKSKKKVAKQFISFDDEDCSSNLSSSLPSSMSSAASEGGDTNSRKLDFKTNTESSSEDTLSDVTGESKESCASTVVETRGQVDAKLTPISQPNVGELTPISIETRMGSNESAVKVSDEVIEVPADISALLTVVERRNEQEMDRLKEKIGLLSKENALLKEQVKNLQGLVEDQRDGEISHEVVKEAKHYEQQLIQVAEMHAEIMDFNSYLHKSLLEKTAQVERLKAQLDEMIGSVAYDDINSDNPRCVNVWIPSAFLTGGATDGHHVYQIYLRAGNDEWSIYRRYSQFHRLHKELKKIDSAVSSFNFPPKKSFSNKDSALVEDRRKRLQGYLRKILQHWPDIGQCNSRYLLEQYLPFFRENYEEEKKKDSKKGIFSSKRPQTYENNYSGL